MERPGLPAELTTRARKGRGGLVVRLLLSLACLAIVFSVVGFEEAKVGFQRLAPWAWGLALVVFLSLQTVSAFKWRWFVRMSGATISGRDAVGCHAAGLFANLCLPSLIGGDMLRLALALPRTRAGTRTSLVLGSIVDRIADLFALAALALFGLLAVPAASEHIGGTLMAIPITVGLMAAGGVSAALALRWLLGRKPLRRQPRKLIQLLRGLRELRRRPVEALAAWVACVAIQAGFVFVNVVVGTSLGLDLDLGMWFLLWPLAKIAAMLPISFGGLGVREAAFAGLLAPWGLEGLAVAQSLVWQSVLIVGGIVAGVYWSQALAAPRGAEAVA